MDANLIYRNGSAVEKTRRRWSSKIIEYLLRARCGQAIAGKRRTCHGQLQLQLITGSPHKTQIVIARRQNDPVVGDRRWNLVLLHRRQVELDGARVIGVRQLDGMRWNILK